MVKGKMDHIGVGLVCALLLLIQYGNGAAVTITSPNSSLSVLTGDTINLTISYSVTPNLILWNYKGSPLAVWTTEVQSIADSYKNRLTLQEKQISIRDSTPADSGEYSVTVTDASGNTGNFKFNVDVADRVPAIQSNDTGIFKTGENISLTIWYAWESSGIVWSYNGTPLIVRVNDLIFVGVRFKGRANITDNGSLLVYNTTNEDAGTYTVTVTNSPTSASQSFQVKFYDVISSVTVQQTPAIVVESTPIVTLSCRASSGSGSVTWQKDGQPLTNDSSHVLLDQDLQILNPDRTFSGNYSCNMSNPVSWNVGSILVAVYYPVGTVKVTQSPQIVSERTSSVNLSCSASTGYIEKVTWLKDGHPIDNSYNLLDGGKILQISQPNRTFSGLYSCNISNAAYWNSSSLLLSVYDPVVNVKVTQSPGIVTESTSLVQLSCSASSSYIESVTWTKEGMSITNNGNYSLLDGNKILQIMQPNRTFSGLYGCNMSNAVYWGTGSLQLRVYDPVVNVKVTQSPGIVSESTSLVQLSCSASSGYIESVTWTKEGMPITNNGNYSLLDGNKILQIMQPNRTFSGLYGCNISNAVYWGTGSLQLRVYDPVENVIMTQSPKILYGNSTVVNLSCNASSKYIEALTWTKDGKSIEKNDTFTLLDGNHTLRINDSKRAFSGNYSCNISNAAYWKTGSLQLLIYDPVENVTVTQSPKIVSENSPAVNLSCGASSGNIETVTWTKDGKPINITNNYNLLNGNLTLQINNPNRTFSGLYICNISNAAYWKSGSLQLLVYDPVLNVKVTQWPDKVTTKTPLVNLSCDASSSSIEKVAWTKDGKTVGSEKPYSLLKGDKVLQITEPDITLSGIYTCIISNAAYSGSGFVNLTVSGATPGAANTFGMMIITLLGGLLLAH
ncbi:hemicentin-1-like [Aquarana catesbeiana]|uniref:hemicentin-1-like n=1 Tax=Aquarana catesbeiana TaxID=8400 RepID=UPI003CCA53ED